MRVPRQAIVLCAGLGRRLAPASELCPKPLLPFLNRPLLEHVLRRLAAAGVRRAWLNAHHRSEQLLRFAERRRFPGLRLEVVVEPELLGTGGGLANIAPRLLPETTLVMAGDVLADFDFASLYARHRATGALATMALTPRADPSRYGAVEIDRRGHLTDLTGLLGQPGCRALVNASAHLLEPSFLARLPRSRSCLVRQGYVPAMRAGLCCVGWVHPGRWHETGTPETLTAAQQAALNGRSPVDAELLALGGVLRPGPALVHPGARIGPDVVLDQGTTVGAGAELGAGTHLSRCLVLGGTRVPPGSHCVGQVLSGLGAASAQPPPMPPASASSNDSRSDSGAFPA